MPTLSIRAKQILGWTVVAIFALGYFLPELGFWTGAILGVWFVGTQQPFRGLAWLVVFDLVSSVITSPRQALTHAAATVVLAVLTALPFCFHRLVSPRLPSLVATLPLPLAGAVLAMLPIPIQKHSAVTTFFAYWFAAIVVWLWNRDGRAGEHRKPADRPEILSLLRSPQTRSALHYDKGLLVSESGERFPIQKGIPSFLKPEDITGSNRKYNQLYETIAGFYDDSQRVWSALSGMDCDAYVMSYLGLLEIKTGDLVLETSVGTGLNFKYLPRDIRRFGLDLSREMLTNCQANLRRWQMDADLFQGNAETLPFADDSFDVVFHTGGINFFNDRAQAIREMIRVAKPGSLMLIADETEQHVKSAYERIPYTSRFFKDREEAVSAPIDLVPADMQDIRFATLAGGRFYALTFRKPANP